MRTVPRAPAGPPRPVSARNLSEPLARRAAGALAWLLHRPGVTAPIIGATKLEHLEDALAAERLSLSDDEMARLAETYQPRAVAGHR